VERKREERKRREKEKEKEGRRKRDNNTIKVILRTIDRIWRGIRHVVSYHEAVVCELKKKGNKSL
jgi:hypothetical protein